MRRSEIRSLNLCNFPTLSSSSFKNASGLIGYHFCIHENLVVTHFYARHTTPPLHRVPSLVK